MHIAHGLTYTSVALLNLLFVLKLPLFVVVIMVVVASEILVNL